MSKITKETKQNKSQFFRLNVRPDKKPFSAIQGNVKNDQIVGTSYEVMLAPPAQFIPNGYEAMVVKKVNGNGKYDGVFEWYDEEKHKGQNPEMIDVRYLVKCASLDKKYQIENGFLPSNDQEEVGWEFPSGQITDIPMGDITPKFIEFMRNHSFNGDNPNRNKSDMVGFYIVDAETNLTKRKSSIDSLNRKLSLMKQIEEDDNFVEAMAGILGVKLGYSVLDKRDIILEMIDTKYEDVSQKVEKYIAETDSSLSYLENTKQLKFQGGNALYNGVVIFKDIDLSKENGDSYKSEIIKASLSNIELFKELKSLFKNSK
jgi:hypothetical protein